MCVCVCVCEADRCSLILDRVQQSDGSYMYVLIFYVRVCTFVVFTRVLEGGGGWVRTTH